ncbi:unnamed protein product [Rotaria sordida]|uniref:Right handed beta helix domain-containing protein n=2 Tax=Rotaria sordida TaxID=392033 RepID=A0A815KNW6_9BILA|nr:unnamed protein product [Rotaria sordida]
MNMNSKVLVYIWVYIIFQYALADENQLYYVMSSGNDDNSGTTQTNAWRTIQKAASKAIAGSTVYIGPGTYYETITILVQGNLFNGSITFTSLMPDNPAIISGENATVASPDGTLNLIYIENKSYLNIINLELANLKGSECSGVRIVGSGTRIELRNLHIHNILGGGKTGGAMAITVYNKNQEASLSKLIIDNCTLYDCEPAWSEALTLNGNIELFQVTNNRVYNMNNIGIDFIGGESNMGALGARSGQCYYNTVWNIHSSYDSSAAGIYVDGGSDINIGKNEVYNSDAGIEIGAENQGRIASGMVVHENYIHDNDKAGLLFGGYDFERGRVINSTFQNNRLENNDVKNTEAGEIVVSFASNSFVYSNAIKPNIKNIILTVDQIGGLDNVFNRQSYYPNGLNANESNLIFNWGNQQYRGLSAFQNATQQELQASVLSSKAGSIRYPSMLCILPLIITFIASAKAY